MGLYIELQVNTMQMYIKTSCAYDNYRERRKYPYVRNALCVIQHALCVKNAIACPPNWIPPCRDECVIRLYVYPLEGNIIGIATMSEMFFHLAAFVWQDYDLHPLETFPAVYDRPICGVFVIHFFYL